MSSRGLTGSIEQMGCRNSACELSNQSSRGGAEFAENYIGFISFSPRTPRLCASARTIKLHNLKGMDENNIGAVIVDTAVKIHKNTGPGLLESVYETILANQLRKFGLRVKRQVVIPIEYDGVSFKEGFRADLCYRGQSHRRVKMRRHNKQCAQKAIAHLPAPGRNTSWLLIKF